MGMKKLVAKRKVNTTVGRANTFSRVIPIIRASTDAPNQSSVPHTFPDIAIGKLKAMAIKVAHSNAICCFLVLSIRCII